MKGEIYDSWNERKKTIAQASRSILFKEGEIWWCALGINIGTESFGKGNDFQRPILVLKKLSADSCIAIPLTSKEKTGTWFQEITIHKDRRWAMLYQVRMIHTKRFQRRVTILDCREFIRVKEKLGALLELNHHLAEGKDRWETPKT